MCEQNKKSSVDQFAKLLQPRDRSASHEMLLRTVPTNSKVFLRGFMNMREKQISTSVIKIQKGNWG